MQTKTLPDWVDSGVCAAVALLGCVLVGGLMYIGFLVVSGSIDENAINRVETPVIQMK